MIQRAEANPPGDTPARPPDEERIEGGSEVDVVEEDASEPGIAASRVSGIRVPEGGSPTAVEAGEREVAGSEVLLAQLEAVLFVAEEAVPARRLAEILGEPRETVQGALEGLRARYAGPGRGIHLVEIADGWRMLTSPACADAVEGLAGRRTRDRLSPAALETLAIVAYRQPVSRAEIERIRGVGVGPVLRHLLELDLIRVSGREEGLGRALLYSTTRAFLDRFGLRRIKDLPASLEL